jgi:hypothetical protein
MSSSRFFRGLGTLYLAEKGKRVRWQWSESWYLTSRQLLSPALFRRAVFRQLQIMLPDLPKGEVWESIIRGYVEHSVRTDTNPFTSRIAET